MHRTHGETGRKEWYTWRNMKTRCLNANRASYRNYGGRGITIYEPWVNDYLLFLAEVGRAPGREYTIERINNNGNYEPGNVRWATPAEQIKNRRPFRKWGGLCKRGHQFDPRDIKPNGTRFCRICHAAYERVRKARIREAGKASIV